MNYERVETMGKVSILIIFDVSMIFWSVRSHTKEYLDGNENDFERIV